MVDLSNGLASLQEISALPRRPEGVDHSGQQYLASAEELIRDDFTAYGYAFDNCDLDAVMAHFSDECVINNPRGQVVGVAAIRKNYRLLFDYWKLMRHMWSNVIVRFPNGLDEAYVGAYHYGLLISDERTLAGVGTDVRRLQERHGRWKIVERWITDDIDFAISVHTGDVEDPERVKELLAEQVDAMAGGDAQ
jgi:hypothetical protein